jgi:hypothetical protein
VPHLGKGQAAEIARRASEFNQPLIPVWRNGSDTLVQLPFCGLINRLASTTALLCNVSQP